MYIQNQTQEQTSKWLQTNFNLHRGMFVTYHFTDSLGFNRGFNTRLLLEKVNKRFLRKLEIYTRVSTVNQENAIF